MKNVKKLTGFILSILMLVSLSACGGQSPDKAVSEYLDALKTYDAETLKNYEDVLDSVDKNLSSFLDEKDKDKVDKESQEIAKKILSNLSYEIVSTKDNRDTATVKVKITNKDFGSGMKTFFTDMFAYALSHLDASEDEMNKYVEKKLNTMIDDAVKSSTTVTNEVTVTLNKKDDKWVIKQNDKLSNAILGNLLDSLNDLSDSFK